MGVLQKQLRLKSKASGIKSPQRKQTVHKHFSNPFTRRKPDTQRMLEDQLSDRVLVSSETQKAIENALKELFRSESETCTVTALAGALTKNNKVIDAEGGIFVRMFFPKRRAEALKNKYLIVGCLNKLQKFVESRTKIVSNFHEAKEALTRVLIFPDGDDDKYAADDADQIAQQHAADVKIEVEQFDGKIQQVLDRGNQYENFAFRKVSAQQVPARLQDDTKSGFVPSISSADDMLQQQYQLKLEERVERIAGESVQNIKARFLEKEREEEAKKRANQLMKPFTEEEEGIINSIMYGIGPPDEVVAKDGADSIQRKSMQHLRPGEWLNDEVIHYFYVMLSNRDEQLQQQDSNRKRSHFFKSFFMTKLLNEGNSAKDGMYEYKNVKRWSKKAPGKNLFNLDKIFFPINEGGMHWICAVAFMQEKRIQMFDSMGSPGMHYLEHIFQYLKDDHKDKQNGELPDADQWKLVECQPDTPRQRNGNDCGVFTCMFADFLSKDCPLVFNQEHVTLCRKRIALSIMNGKAVV